MAAKRLRGGVCVRWAGKGRGGGGGHGKRLRKGVQGTRTPWSHGARKTEARHSTPTVPGTSRAAQWIAQRIGAAGCARRMQSCAKNHAALDAPMNAPIRRFSECTARRSACERMRERLPTEVGEAVVGARVWVGTTVIW